MKEIALLTDQALGERSNDRADGLGFGAYARVLAAAAAETAGPFTIGVFSEWGTGKTSLLRLVQRELAEEDDVITVWFNAWRYERESHLIVPLVGTMIREIEKQRSARDKLKASAAALIQGLRALAYGFSASSKVHVPGFAEVEASFVAKDMIERAEHLKPDPLLDRSLYFDAYDRLSALANAPVKVVILIDDLDRCFPDRAIKLLESVKLVLSQPGFVFILATARTVVEGYLRFKFHTKYGMSDFHAEAYLDKIVQLPFYIPPHAERMPEFCRSLVDQVGLPAGEAAVFSSIVPVIGTACDNNPRNVVQFINRLIVDASIYRDIHVGEGGDADHVPLGVFAVSRSLEKRWPKLYSTLVKADNLCEKIPGWLNANLASLEGESMSEKLIIEGLRGDDDLRALLDSRYGREWLTESELRRSVTQFLVNLPAQSPANAIQREITITFITPKGEPWTEAVELLRAQYRKLRHNQMIGFLRSELVVLVASTDTDIPEMLVNAVNEGLMDARDVVWLAELDWPVEDLKTTWKYAPIVCRVPSLRDAGAIADAVRNLAAEKGGSGGIG